METEPCPSDWKLDRYLLGEAEQTQIASVEAHLTKCASCRERVSARDSTLARFREKYPSFLALDRALGHLGRKTPARARFWTLSTGLAAAAGFVLLLGGIWKQQGLLPGQGLRGDRSSDQVERGKGGLSLGYHVKRGDRIYEAGTEEQLQSGDAVQFTVNSARPGYLAILSLDGQGVASVFYPLGPQAEALSAGRRSLPGSTVLDDAPGQERVWAMLCERPFSLEPVRLDLAQRGREALSRDGCQVASVSFEKVPSAGQVLDDAQNPKRTE